MAQKAIKLVTEAKLEASTQAALAEEALAKAEKAEAEAEAARRKLDESSGAADA